MLDYVLSAKHIQRSAAIHSFLPSDVEEVHTASLCQFFVLALTVVYWHQPICLAQPGMSPYVQAVISVKFTECT